MVLLAGSQTMPEVVFEIVSGSGYPGFMNEFADRTIAPGSCNEYRHARLAPYAEERLLIDFIEHGAASWRKMAKGSDLQHTVSIETIVLRNPVASGHFKNRHAAGQS